MWEVKNDFYKNKQKCFLSFSKDRGGGGRSKTLKPEDSGTGKGFQRKYVQ